MRCSVSCLVGVVAGSLSCGANAWGGMWVVDGTGGGDHESIQAALDTAEPGDEVLVLPGLYTENVQITSAGIRLRGRDGPGVTTVRAADPSHPVIAVSGDEVLVEGLEIREGALGVGVASPTKARIRDCQVNDNDGSAVSAGRPTGDVGRVEVSRCRIQRNGQGVYVLFKDGGDKERELLVEDCVIIDNGGTGVRAGASFVTWPPRSNVAVERCRIRRNGGSGIEVVDVWGAANACLLSENGGAGVSGRLDPFEGDPGCPWSGFSVEDSVLRGNVGPGVAGGVRAVGCLVEGNAGGALAWDSALAADRRVTGSVIVGNNSPGAILPHCSCWLGDMMTEVEQCVLVGNRSESGAPLFQVDSEILCSGGAGAPWAYGSFRHVTAAGNQSDGFSYGGSICSFPIERNIVWTTDGPAFDLTSAGEPPWDGVTVDDNCGNGGLLPDWPDNVESDPQFVRPGEFDFTRFRSIVICGTEHQVPDFVLDRGDYRVEPGSPAAGMGAMGIRGDLPVEGRAGEVIASRFPLAPVVDGRLEDEVWQTAHWHGPTHRLDDPAGAADAGFEVAAAADGRWLYVAVRVIDDVLVSDESPDDPSHDDSIAIYLDPDHAQTSGYGPDDVQIVIGAGSIGRDPLDPVISGNGGGALSGTRAAARSDLNGWTLEAAIPLSLEGRWDITPEHGSRLGFEIQVNDDDDGGDRDSVLTWSRWNFDEAAESPGVFGSLEFVRAEGAEAPEPDIQVEPTSVDCGEIAIGSEDRFTLDLRNMGDAMLSVSPPRLSEGSSPDFRLAGDASPWWLEPSEQMVVELVYTPTTPGPAEATILLETDDPDEPLVAVPVAGSGLMLHSFLRADANDDGQTDLSDAIRTLNYLFRGGLDVSCLDAADANDDGAVDISDAVYTLGYLFAGTAAPPPPFPDCGVDPTEDDLPTAGSSFCTPTP